jgi:DNA modification methylase
MNPWLDDGDVRLYQGDAVEVLRELPAGSVHMACTSPPFYGLRDYGVPGQIGLEPTPDEWAARLVDVFREVRRVLRDDGTLWVEIGDSYNAYNGNRGPSASLSAAADEGRNDPPRGLTTEAAKPKDLIGAPWLLAFALRADGWYLRSEIVWAKPNPMPESVTDRPTTAHSRVFLFAKRPRYFYDAEAVREDFEARPQQRLTSLHEQPAHAARVNAGVAQGNPQGGSHASRFTIQCGCLEAGCVGDESCGCACHVADEAPRGPDGRRVTAVKGQNGSVQHRDGERWPNAGRNKRSVWTVPTEPTPFAHFATWPQKLVEPMVLAGTSERGCCPECGAPWERETELTPEYAVAVAHGNAHRADGVRGEAGGGTHANAGNLGPGAPRSKQTVTIGWRPSCPCYGTGNGSEGGPVVPAVVLDPFAGSGTTMLVARRLGRRSIGVELNPGYCQIAAERLSQLSLLGGMV